MKKLLAVFLSLTLIVQLVVPAWADSTAAAADVTDSALVQTDVSGAEEKTQDAAASALSSGLTAEQLLLEGKVEGKLTRKLLFAAKENGYYTDVEEVISLLRSKMVERQTKVEIPLRVSTSEISEAELEALILGIFALAADHTGVADEGDYLLWQIGQIGYGADYYVSGDYYYLDITYSLSYYTTQAQETQVANKLAAVIAGFGFTAETDDYTKVKTIYDYICENVVYDYEHLEDTSYTLKHSAYAALENGTSVCQGYALLLYRMLLMAGIDCRIISGYDAESGEAHAWNIVRLGNFYYNVDSTWDATIHQAGGEYQYFLKAPANFTDHVRDEVYTIPEFHQIYPMAGADYVFGEPGVIASGTCGDGVNWVLGIDGILTVSGNGAMEDYYLNAPWGSYSDYIRSVVIEEGVTSVGKNAFFNVGSLTAVYFPSSLKSIGSNAFGNCYFIEEVHIVDLAAWCQIAFGESNVGENPLYYGNYLYLNGEKITDLTIPNTVTSISPYAFRGGVFQKVTIPGSVSTIGNGAFYDAKITELSLSDGLVSIGESAFYRCSASEVTFPRTLQSIGAGAFSGSALTTVVLPDTLTDLDSYAFSGCSTLQSVIIGDGLEIIPMRCFAECPMLKDVAFGQNVHTIGMLAFEGATGLTAIQIPASVKTIERGAFYECANLRQVVFAEGLESIGLDAFYKCTSIENLVFPTTLTQLDQSALEKCTSLKSVTFIGNAPTFAWSCFRDTTLTAYYPAGNSTWTSEILQNYEGNVTWRISCTAHIYENGTCTLCGAKDPDFIPVGLKGDADGSGEVDYLDAMLVLQYHTGIVGDDALNSAVCDVDDSGEVDYLDAMLVLQYHTGIVGDDALNSAVCDVDDSGEVDYLDAMLLLQYHTGVIPEL